MSLPDELTKLLPAAVKDGIEIIGHGVVHLFPGQFMERAGVSHDACIVDGYIQMTVSINSSLDKLGMQQ